MASSSLPGSPVPARRWGGGTDAAKRTFGLQQRIKCLLACIDRRMNEAKAQVASLLESFRTLRLHVWNEPEPDDSTLKNLSFQKLVAAVREGIQAMQYRQSARETTRVMNTSKKVLVVGEALVFEATIINVAHPYMDYWFRKRTTPHPTAILKFSPDHLFLKYQPKMGKPLAREPSPPSRNNLTTNYAILHEGRIYFKASGPNWSSDSSFYPGSNRIKYIFDLD